MVLTSAVQFGGVRFHPGQANLIAPLILAAFVICVGALIVPLLGLAVSSSREALRGWRARRRRLAAAAGAEVRARAMMSELCPHGWRAQITILAGDEEHAGEGRSGVALDWTELEDERGTPAVMRRVWAPTIGEALEAMVADRRTDETLEQIERGAVADGALWPDT
jgi:hypothetical protein